MHSFMLKFAMVCISENLWSFCLDIYACKVCLKSCTKNLSGELVLLRIQVPIVDFVNCLGLFFWGEREEEAKGDESITSHPATKK